MTAQARFFFTKICLLGTVGPLYIWKPADEKGNDNNCNFSKYRNSRLPFYLAAFFIIFLASYFSPRYIQYLQHHWNNRQEAGVLILSFLHLTIAFDRMETSLLRRPMYAMFWMLVSSIGYLWACVRNRLLTGLVQSKNGNENYVIYLNSCHS